LDSYLEIIEDNEAKIRLLEEKKGEIRRSNNERNRKAAQYEKEEERCHQNMRINHKRKYYLDNKKKCKNEFFRKAICFGLKCGSGFMGVILLLVCFIGELHSLPMLQFLLSFITVSSLLGLVELKNVSREYRRLLRSYHGDINQDISDLQDKIDFLKARQIKNRKAIEINQSFLQEIDSTLKQLREQSNEYRNSRNELINELISNLDNYIEDFSSREIDIHKIMEKTIL